MAVEPWHDPGYQPTRLTHLDDRDERAFWVERGKRSAQVIGLSHGGTFRLCCRAKVACLAAGPIASTNATAPPPCSPPSTSWTAWCSAAACKGTPIRKLIRFLNAVERQVPAGKIIHAILDNYATHKHPKVRDWLARHPRWVFHFTPISGSWLNAVENFFSALTRRRLRRGVFKSIVDLQAAINRYVDEHNADPKPFLWTRPADLILAKVSRLPVPSV
jgi:transposase